MKLYLVSLINRDKFQKCIVFIMVKLISTQKQKRWEDKAEALGLTKEMNAW